MFPKSRFAYNSEWPSDIIFKSFLYIVKYMGKMIVYIHSEWVEFWQKCTTIHSEIVTGKSIDLGKL